MSLHPLVWSAADGHFPEWSRADATRREHAERVADLMGRWARELHLPKDERARWRAAAILHDVLREAPPDELRALAPEGYSRLPDRLLHGPAAARRLRDEGISDPGLLFAVAHHTLGHPDLDRMGRALYAADFLEPGRDLSRTDLAQLREGMAAHEREVVTEVVRRRIGHVLERGWILRSETVEFWNRLVSEAREG